MIYTEDTIIEKLSIHTIGNKFTDQLLILSQNEILLNDDTSETLKTYFLKSFVIDSTLKFFHESIINYNIVYSTIKQIFENPNSLHENSVVLAKHLYERSDNPNIIEGEFYTVYFKNCNFNGKVTDAIGLFKSENKNTFIKVKSERSLFSVDIDKGININKLDKGCLVFNIDEENGYVVSIVDNRNKGTEAKYWIDDFLHVCQRKDEYSNTQNVLSLCKNFITKELPNEFEIAKADQIDLLNKSLSFFKENDNFDIDDFTREVIIQPDIIEKFESFKNEFEEINDFKIDESFAISNNAVKKLQRSIKRIISLDKKIKIIIEGNREHIEQGIDEKGRKYYKIFYQEEL